MAYWWGRGPFDNIRAGNRCGRGGTATTDRSIRTDARDGGVTETAQFAGTTTKGAKLPFLPVALRQGLPLDLLRELVVEEHVRPISKIGQHFVKALRALG